MTEIRTRPAGPVRSVVNATGMEVRLPSSDGQQIVVDKDRRWAAPSAPTPPVNVAIAAGRAAVAVAVHTVTPTGAALPRPCPGVLVLVTPEVAAVEGRRRDDLVCVLPDGRGGSRLARLDLPPPWWRGWRDRVVDHVRGWGRRLGRSHWAADVAVASLLAALTAVVALVLEDVLPAPGMSIRDAGWSGWRIGFLSVAFVLLLVFLGWRRRVHRTTGTLFYVRMLDEVFVDWHERAAAAAFRRRMDMQVVSRWVDLRPDDDGVIDVVTECDQLVTQIESAVNSDRHDTATAVAPNVLWPIAFAVGRVLHGFIDVRLVELSDQPEARRSSHRTIRMEPWPTPLTDGGGRVGVVAWFTDTMTDHFRESLASEMKSRDVNSAWLLTLDRPANTNDPASADELAELGRELTEHLAGIRRRTAASELVVYARLAKVTALATGQHLATSGVRFFDRTYLMNWEVESGRYVAMRVHPSQPAGLPTTAGTPVTGAAT